MPDSRLVITVSELARNVRLALEREFPLLWVAGEISNLARAASGHVYFSLKDEAAQLRCVMFRSRAQSVPWRLENGQQVEVRGLPSLYELRGDFQLSVENVRRAGLGRLHEAFARLKQRLEAEGLFAAGRKRELPRYPRAIGIVSSPAAAALQDVIATVRRRAPHVRLVLYPAAVQGDGAPDALAAAIRSAGERQDCALLLVVRGGGSMEDLWAFNEEAVARALADSRLPTISGVGHESDFTIADFVADHRAATPTAAAELATQGWLEAASRAGDLASALRRNVAFRLGNLQQQVDRTALRLVHPAARLQRARDALSLFRSRLSSHAAAGIGGNRQHTGRLALRLFRAVPRTESAAGGLRLLEQRLVTAAKGIHTARRHRLEAIAKAMAHLNPEAILQRGYVIVRDRSGAVVTDARQLGRKQEISLRFARGEADAMVIDTRPE